MGFRLATRISVTFNLTGWLLDLIPEALFGAWVLLWKLLAFGSYAALLERGDHCLV